MSIISTLFYDFVSRGRDGGRGFLRSWHSQLSLALTRRFLALLATDYPYCQFSLENETVSYMVAYLKQQSYYMRTLSESIVYNSNLKSRFALTGGGIDAEILLLTSRGD